MPSILARRRTPRSAAPTAAQKPAQRPRGPEPRLGPPTFTGAAILAQVGTQRWGIPPGSRVAYGERPAILYVITPDDALHVLTDRDGEVREVLNVPDSFAQRLRAHYFPHGSA